MKILKIVVSLVLISLILSKVDLQSLIINFRLLNPYFMPLIVGLIILNYVVSSIRWKLLLIGEEAKDVSVSYLSRLYFVGSFFNNFMPTSIGGDVYKIFKLGKRIKSNTKAFSATFMERFTGVVALVLISYFGLVRSLDFWLAQIPLNPLFVKVLLFGGFWILAGTGFLLLKIFAKKIYDSLFAYKNHKNILLGAFLTSFVVQFLAIFTQYLIFVGLGSHVPVLQALFVFPVIILASFFVPSLNGIGVQDALYIYFFTGMGLTSELALSASLLYHLFRLFVSLFGGVLYAFNKTD